MIRPTADDLFRAEGRTDRNDEANSRSSTILRTHLKSRVGRGHTPTEVLQNEYTSAKLITKLKPL